MALGSIIPWIIGGIILLIIVGFVLYTIGIYNRFFKSVRIEDLEQLALKAKR